MPRVDTSTIQLGSILNLVGQGVSLITIVVVVTLAYGSLRERDVEFEQRLKVVETKIVRVDSDHELLVRIDEKLTALDRKVSSANRFGSSGQ